MQKMWKALVPVHNCRIHDTNVMRDYDLSEMVVYQCDLVLTIHGEGDDDHSINMLGIWEHGIAQYL